MEQGAERAPCRRRQGRGDAQFRAHRGAARRNPIFLRQRLRDHALRPEHRAYGNLLARRARRDDGGCREDIRAACGGEEVGRGLAHCQRCRTGGVRKLLISPLAGEMSGRTEGGAVPPASQSLGTSPHFVGRELYLVAL
ncbi:hypothetical protein FJW10_26310 [Mesorhizobium sp. B4-1-1]|nr:hypothetical protein FJW10_26310 [Mesorhizobium sp. B4-1-1]